MMIETTHVGSLPRPAEMNSKTLRKLPITNDDLQRYVAAIMKRQMETGITYINNGEIPRDDYVSSTVSRISGFSGTCIAPLPQDLEELPEYSRRFGGRNGLITLNPKAPVRVPACSDQLKYTGATSLKNEIKMMTGIFKELKNEHTDLSSQLFFTSPSPGTVALFMDNTFYPDDDAYLQAIAGVLKQEYEIIAGYGICLQIDCPDLAMGRHTKYKHLKSIDFLKVIDKNVSVLNQALSEIDTSRVRAHICWGNYPGTHHCDIDLREIFDHVMRLDAKFISIESSNHRHGHEWELFEELSFPKDKVLMPGVIDTTSNNVEHPQLVAQRLSNYIRPLGPDRVMASTDCGFASTASAASVSGEVAWLKLASLVEGARIASKRFS